MQPARWCGNPRSSIVSLSGLLLDCVRKPVPTGSGQLAEGSPTRLTRGRVGSIYRICLQILMTCCSEN
jgi:hypothetical protein